jgi:SAM-dependent methyltransferase
MLQGIAQLEKVPLAGAIGEIYRHRFQESLLERRHAVWKVLCESWFQRYIPTGARVLEIGAGYCEFINNVQAATRVAIDVNPATRHHAGAGVVVHEIAAEQLTDRVRPGSFDVAFMSNFLEHCGSRDQVLLILRNLAQALKPGGRIMILGPNFRFCYKHYFDFFDHTLALSEKAIVEALRLAGFEPEVVRPRTLPFTFGGRLPSWPWLVGLYLRMPWVWPLFGAQFFVVARNRAAIPLSNTTQRRAA